MENIFEASRTGNLELVKQLVTNGADLNQWSDYGFTPLQTAALGSNLLKEADILPTIQYLIKAGSDVNILSKDGRSALFLMAEFSQSMAPIRLLVDAGANPNIKDSYGNHIIENALLEEAQRYLSKLTGKPIPAKEPELEEVKMKASQWTSAKKAMKPVFEQLAQKGLIVLQDAGYTQQDGFQDCVEEYYEHPNQDNIIGFCFYTRQDQNTAKRTSQLHLGFWGAPDGNDAAIIKVGKIITEAFVEAGFNFSWNESADLRPVILLYSFSKSDR